MKSSEISKVIVVFKTHLDIGFTDLADHVLQQYCDSFIPEAVELAYKVNTPGQKKFVWTVGSYLIKHYFQHADEASCKKLEEAIRLGYVRWHGLACTTHTELMNRRLIDYDLSLSKTLDQRFGFQTIAAKMTDVPGHTIGLVPALAQAGIEYLHLGVNGSSRVPDVPSLFLWKCQDAEVIVNYAKDYGDVSILENGTALEFFHARDNASPPTPQELDTLFESLAVRYPNAHIEAGTLDDFALAAREIKHTLPVITEEIGDTWIHGTATDPWKVSCFRRLLNLTDSWIAEGKLTSDSQSYDNLMENLLLIAEHTWGMDVKKYLLDFKNWDKKSFQEARSTNLTDDSFFDTCNQAILNGMQRELHHYHGSEIQSSYSRFETSHQEQREYIQKALDALPVSLQEEARTAMTFTWPSVSETVHSYHPWEPIPVGNFTVIVGSAGELLQITDSATGTTKNFSIGLAEYEVFGGKEVDACYYEYGRDLKDNYYWSEPDFGKPGLHYHKEIQHAVYQPVPISIQVSDQTLYIFLRFPQEACESYGCPRDLAAVYRLDEKKIHLELFWKNKDAIRSPEAFWLNFNLNVKNPNLWTMNKSGTDISPSHVRYDGNRKLHCVQQLDYCQDSKHLSIQPIDTPLVSPGGKTLYHADNQFEDLNHGFYFLLYNNRWGTNFKQWYDEDMRFAFHIQYD